MREQDESGQLMVLTMGLTLVVFAVAGLAIDGTRAFVMKRSLQNAADSAVVAASAEIDTSMYYASGGSQVRLDEQLARSVAIRSLTERGFPADAELVADEHFVTVVLRSESRTTFLKLVGIDNIPVVVTSSARAFTQAVPNGP